MKEVKLFKDPIYGYISISQNIVKEIINTPNFQRLRHISQTSYAPLYPSATHNRFVHSIGVYHLGEIAGNSILEKTDDLLFSKLQLLTKERLFEIFKYACILHDIGHAPFSHTGEMFYLNAKDDYSELHRELNSLVNDDSFSNDCPKTNSESAAPHEIMSAIVGIKCFSSLFKDNEEKSFFARCITGYLYKEATTDKKNLNCFISLLNSNIIDVDKLDYLMRDSYTSGFESVKIDYVRLLSLKITQDDETHFYLAYEKNALSVIENVVYAHDAEKKWIQSHPIVLYESYLLQHSLLQLVKDLKLKKNTDLFCSAALSEDGIKLPDETTINLLCDTDIVFLLKNKYRNKYFSEYLNRNMWRKPLWKSESEYAMLFLLKMGQEPSKKFTSAMTSASEYVDKNTSQGVINEELYNSLCKDIKKTETTSDIVDTETNKIQNRQKRKIKKIIDILKKFSEDNAIPFDYILIKQSQFMSGFGKENFSKIKIEFRGEKARLVNFGEVASPLTQEKLAKDDFYYIYCPNNKEIPKDILIKELRNSFIDD